MKSNLNPPTHTYWKQWFGHIIMGGVTAWGHITMRGVNEQKWKLYDLKHEALKNCRLIVLYRVVKVRGAASWSTVIAWGTTICKYVKLRNNFPIDVSKPKLWPYIHLTIHSCCPTVLTLPTCILTCLLLRRLGHVVPSSTVGHMMLGHRHPSSG